MLSQASTLQRKLVLDDTPSLVLATVEAARAELPGHDEDDILALIDEGLLLYAWNIGLGESREVRIWPDCIAHYKRTLGSRQYPQSDSQVTAAILRALRLSGTPAAPATWVRGSTLRLLLNCSSTHVINLVEARVLQILPGTTWQTGPNGSPLIAVPSLLAFFKSRRLL